MRPADRSYSPPRKPARNRDEKTSGPERDFVSLVGPVTGEAAAAGLFRRVHARCTLPGGVLSLMKTGAIAAFFLEDYDDSVPLDNEDWDDIRETLEESAGEMNLDALTALMDGLLSRGKLKG
jgi:hypothetical protein